MFQKVGSHSENPSHAVLLPSPPPSGRDEEAVAVLRKVAARNKTECLVTVEILRDACLAVDIDPKQSAATSFRDDMRRSFANVDFSHVKALFVGTRMAINTSIIITVSIVGAALSRYNTD